MREIREISIAWERQTGADSIPTIERIYGRTDKGAYECVWPECEFKRRDPVAMWRHVHTAHGTNSLPPDLIDTPITARA